MADGNEPLAGLKGDDLILQRARERFKRCKEWQGKADEYWLEDTKFANADARNHNQWPETEWNERDDDGVPALTINKTRVHNNIIINESLQNKSSIKVRPTGGIASYESSQAMQMMIRRIEYMSKADSVYEKAFRDQIDGGIGYVLIDTKFVNDRTFNQDIFLRRCKDPLCVFLDPDIKEADGLDANFGFEFELMAQEKFDKEYRKFKQKVGKNTTLGNDDNWLTSDQIQVAMYYERDGKKDTFISFVDPATQKRIEKMESEIRDESGDIITDKLIADIENGIVDGRMRDVFNQSVKWYLIGGDYIMKRGDWAGSYIPIARCPGIETVIEGEYDRKGHTRWLIDPQKMLNYNASAAIEFGAMQNKVPYVGPARAFEGQEQWKDANRKRYAFLQFNDIDEEAPQGMEKIAAPERQQPPTTAPVYMQGMQDAERQMMMASGQYQAQLGEEDQQSAASGKAINERQRQGDTATYHFVEHQGDMMRNIGIQLLELIPKTYDTERMLHVLGDDGTKQWIKIDPNQDEAIKELKQENEEAAIISLNPKVGEYDCMADPGPNYATQRQEAWNAISLILQQNAELATTIGDLLFKFGDFPGADEIMERLKKEIQQQKPWLFTDNPNPQLIAAQQQLQRLTALNADLVQKLALKELALKGRDEKRDVEAFRAESDRLKVTLDFMTKVMLTPQQKAQLEHELISKAHDASMQMLIDANAAELQPAGKGASE